eukprot:gb/GECH01001554.1/.p1 GENE.gb/GECH01001554.1/~~gb/GECH01001554.1/.p1  ORF type:complete len:261 (+),score=78.53 gb/GECH01001554.1/:1-783(+)
MVSVTLQKDNQGCYIAKTLLQLRKWTKEIEREVKFTENQCERLYTESNTSTGFAPNFADFLDEMFPNSGQFRSRLVELISLENDLHSLCDSAALAVNTALKQNFSPFVFRNTADALREVSKEISELHQEREESLDNDIGENDEKERILNRVCLMRYIADKCKTLIHHLYWMLSSISPKLRHASPKYKRTTEVERLNSIDSSVDQIYQRINSVISSLDFLDESNDNIIPLNISQRKTNTDCSMGSPSSSTDDIPTSPVFCV